MSSFSLTKIIGEQPYSTLTDDEIFSFSLACVALVLVSGTFAGLGLALFSIDVIYLKVMSTTGPPSDQKRAKRLLPLLQRQHLTLVAIVVTNATVATALPPIMSRLLSPPLTLALSVTLILLFGEILPQALFVRYALPISAFFAPLLWVLIGVTFVVSWPMAWVLDVVVGHKHAIMERDQLGEFLCRHGETESGGEAKLSAAEVMVMKGALELSRLKVHELMKVTIDKAFMLSSNDDLDQKTIEKILSSGFSRVPIYRANDRQHILGVLLVKSLLPLAFTVPSRPPPVASCSLRDVLRISEDAKVRDLYAAFLSGVSHMAVVYNKRGIAVGILTLEEVFDMLHGCKIDNENSEGVINLSPRQTTMLNVLATAKMDPSRTVDFTNYGSFAFRR